MLFVVLNVCPCWGRAREAARDKANKSGDAQGTLIATFASGQQQQSHGQQQQSNGQRQKILAMLTSPAKQYPAAVADD